MRLLGSANDLDTIATNASSVGVPEGFWYARETINQTHVEKDIVEDINTISAEDETTSR
jgi:hypothetical protein